MKLTHIVPATFDERGDISDILFDQEFQHSAIVNSKGGNIVRGNHYHKLTTQYIFLTRGYLWYWFKALDADEPQRILVNEYDLVETPALEIHTLHILVPTQFIVYANGQRGGMNYESDTFRVPSILPKDIDADFYR